MSKKRVTFNKPTRTIKSPGICKPYYKEVARIDVHDWLAILDILRAHGETISKRKLNWETLILENRLACPETEEVALYIRYDIMMNKHDKEMSHHFNFYSDKDNLLTIDHIKPVSKGGAHVGSHNIQPMVDKFNFLKSDKYDEPSSDCEIA